MYTSTNIMDIPGNITPVSTGIHSQQDNVTDLNDELAQELNDKMTRAVLPVTVFVGIEVFMAFFGNLIVIYVFLFRYHECNFKYFVLCLAFTDITSSLTTMPGEMVTQLYWYVYPVPEVCKIKSFFNIFTVSSEALCLLTIAVDRYLKVCRPLGWQMTPKHAKYICGVIYLIAFILAVPVYIFWGTHKREMIYRNMTITVEICEKDEKWVDTNNPLEYSITMEVILSCCLVCMLVLYVFVARALLGNKRIRFQAYTLKPHTGSSSSTEETSQNQIERKSTPDVIDSDQPSRTNQPPGNQELQEGDQNKTEIGTGRKSKRKTLTVVINDDDHDPREKHNKVLTLIRNINHGITHHTHHRHSGHEHSHHTHDVTRRVRRKTLIMFILTVVFIITTILYLTLLSLIARSILDDMSDSGKAVYFFFFRLYFINHVINPIIYGVLDPHFKQVLKNIRDAVQATGSSY